MHFRIHAFLLLLFFANSAALADSGNCPTDYGVKLENMDGCSIDRALAGDKEEEIKLLKQLRRIPPHNDLHTATIEMVQAGVAASDPRYVSIRRYYMDLLKARIAALETLEARLESDSLRIQKLREDVERYAGRSLEVSMQRDLERVKARHGDDLRKYERLGGEEGIVNLQRLLIGYGDRSAPGNAIVQVFETAEKTPENRQTLLGLLEQAKSAEDGTAESVLGFLYETGDWVNRDMPRAIEYYEEGWRKGAWVAGYRLARQKLPGGHLETDKEAAYGLLTAARAAIWEAPYDPKNVADRRRLQEELNVVFSLIGPLAYEKAAEYARVNDMANALAYYEVAANSGVQEAKLALGYMYRTGSGMAKASEHLEGVWFAAAARCDVEFRQAPYFHSEELCDQAKLEVKNIRLRKQGRAQAERARTYAVMGLIGLAILGAAGGASADSYEPPNIDHNSGIQMAAELMWMGKW